MSNILTSFLGTFAGGLFGDTGYLKDYKHAARLYQDNNYGMTPKAGWSYFVEIGLNPSLLNKATFPAVDDLWYNRSKGKIGLLAKTVDLPRVSITHETLNQYNRKSVIQTKLTYNPISITFHDDMDNMITGLWKNYYQYYFADSRYTSEVKGTLSSRTLSEPESFSKFARNGSRAYSYGLNNQQSDQFISFIKIFLLNRRKYSSVTLINPKIIEWQPATLDQSNGAKLLDAKISVAYESIYYDNANTSISKTNPGFNQLPYDNSPSPLSIYGRGSRSLFGPGGLVAGANDLLGTLTQEGPLSAADLLKVAVGTKNLVDNAKQLSRTKGAISGELYSVTAGVFAGAASGRGALGESVVQAASSPVNLNLFKTSQTSGATPANYKNLGGGGR
jgi:hypothetical protein